MVSLHLASSSCWHYGFSNPVLSKILFVQEAYARTDVILAHTPGIYNVADFLTKVRPTALQAAVKDFRSGGFLLQPVSEWPMAPIRVGESQEVKKLIVETPDLFSNNLSRKRSKIQLSDQQIQEEERARKTKYYTF